MNEKKKPAPVYSKAEERAMRRAMDAAASFMRSFGKGRKPREPWR